MMFTILVLPLLAIGVVGAQQVAAQQYDPQQFAYVTNAQSDSVSVINTATNTVVATIPVGTGGCDLLP